MPSRARTLSDDLSVVGRISSSSKPGCLTANLPAYCRTPPIEVVVFGWGVTEDGQLGLDALHDVVRPSVIESLLGTNFSGFQFNRRPIVAGSRNTLAVTETGRVLSWGWNDRGTLGLGHRRSTSKPTAIEGLAHERIVQVAAGGWHCLAVTQQGQLYAWGGNEYFQCGVDAGKRDVCIPKLTVPSLEVKMVSCGGMHSIALTTTGYVWQWGEPWGDFSMDINRAPRQLDVQNVESVVSGAFHNLALTSTSQVVAWGTNDFGQLGTGDTTYAVQPRLVQGLDDEDIADISAGGWHSLALTAKGRVYTWGRGEYGRLGLNEPKGLTHMRPCLVPTLENHVVVQAACGGSHTMVLTDKGRMFIWGRCSNGRMGSDAERTVESPAEISLPGGSERWQPICIAVGGRHSMCMALPRHTVIGHERRLTMDRLTCDSMLPHYLQPDAATRSGTDSIDGNATDRSSQRVSGSDYMNSHSLLARSLVDLPMPLPHRPVNLVNADEDVVIGETINIQPSNSFLHRQSNYSDVSYGDATNSTAGESVISTALRASAGGHQGPPIEQAALKGMQHVAVPPPAIHKTNPTQPHIEAPSTAMPKTISFKQSDDTMSSPVTPRLTQQDAPPAAFASLDIGSPAINMSPDDSDLDIHHSPVYDFSNAEMPSTPADDTGGDELVAGTTPGLEPADRRVSLSMPPLHNHMIEGKESDGDSDSDVASGRLQTVNRTKYRQAHM